MCLGTRLLTTNSHKKNKLQVKFQKLLEEEKESIKKKEGNGYIDVVSARLNKNPGFHAN